MTCLAFAPLSDAPAAAPKVKTVPALDAVLDGGYVQGAAILVCGAPGAGKSTLLLQAAAAIPGSRYITGEETAAAVAQRAARLGISDDADVQLAVSNDADAIAADMRAMRAPLVIVDSLQSVITATSKSARGNLAQIRATAVVLVAACRASGSTLILVCHETKAGGFAGPREVEHYVDVAIRLERKPRTLIAVKNRHGKADVLIPVQMTEHGVVANLPRDYAAEVRDVHGSIAAMGEALAELLKEFRGDAHR